MKYIFLLLFLLAAGCGGFKPSSTVSFNPDEGGKATDIDYQLMIQTGPHQGKLVVDQIRNSSIKILVPVGLNNFVPVGNLLSNPWSFSGRVAQDENSFKTLEIQVPVSYVAQGVSGPTVMALPNGDALDFISNGQAEHISFPLNGTGTVNLHLYFSPPYLLGVFIQTPFDLGSTHRYPVMPVNGLLQMGFFSTHPHRPPLNGGSFVFISLPR